MISLKQFLLETQQRIDGIKKVHLPKITGMFNGKTTHDIMMNGVKINRFSELYDIADKTGVLDRQNHSIFANQMEGLKHSAAHYTANILIDTAANTDPDQLKHKHTEWIVNQWKKGHVRVEDFGGRVRDTLTHFMEHGQKLPNKDINSYKHIADLDAALKPHIQVEEKGGKVSDMLDKHPGAKLVHDEPGLRVHEIISKDASKAIRTTDPECKWCTTRHEDDQNYHDSYTNPSRFQYPTNKLFVVHAADDKGETHMMQFHFGSKQFNTKDNVNMGVDVALKRFPKIRNVSDFHEMGKDYLHKFVSAEKASQLSKSSKVEDRRMSALFDGSHIQNLVDDKDFVIRRRISEFAGPHLVKMAKEDHDPIVRINLAKKPGEHLKYLTKDPDRKVRELSAQHPGEHLKVLVNDKEAVVRRAVAFYHNDPKMLAKLAKDPDDHIRLTAAGHPGKHLKILAKDPNPDIRWNIAIKAVTGRANGYREHLPTLAKDPDNDIRHYLASNYSTGRDVLTKLTKDKHPSVAQAARNTLRI